MTPSLLVISIGPVQDFIASARRTRDLWFGSYLLSEISKAAARVIVKASGEDSLIFPSPGENALLDPDSDLNVANVILAKVENPEAVFEVAREAAKARWSEFADEALGKAQRELDINTELWESQVEDAIECYGAWTPLEGNYRQARRQVMRLLAARKQCRDFRPNEGLQGVPKSSLDGLRESVIKGKPSRKTLLSLGIKDSEKLCAIGLTKRVAGGKHAFPSVSRVAAEPWIRAAAAASDPDIRENWDSLKDVCEQLKQRGLISTVRGNEAYSRVFPYEGSVLFRNRLEDLLPEEETDLKLVNRISDLLKELQSPKACRAPSPYLAILAADGDRVGRTISGIESPKDHRNFSADLSGFAGAARKIIQESSGVCVYSGGDDVLAFVPLDRVLSCARKLRQDFVERLRKWKDSEGKSPTLSVGIAVGHIMEDLADLLKFAREAEALAKGDGRKNGEARDALAVVVRARGNEACAVRERWEGESPVSSLDELLLLWAKLHAEGGLPSKFAYELRQTAELYREPEDEAKGPSRQNFFNEALRKDVLRIFARKDVRLKEHEGKAIVGMIERIEGSDGLMALSNELIIGQWLAEGMKMEKGGN
jgi:CRISPR-associated protein Cmr2